MKFKVFRTDSIDKGINSKSGKPFIFKDVSYIIYKNYIKYDSNSRLSIYKKYKIISIEWYKFKLYITLSIIDNENIITCTPCNYINGLLLFVYLKFNITNLLVWIGGILNTIFNDKKIFN